MTVAIIGAGIGGLSLGLSLHKLNIPFKIYESVKVIKPLGVGINIQPHAVRELYALGLEHKLNKIGLQTKEVGYFSAQGGLIWSEKRGLHAGYNWPQYSIHRGSLQKLLYQELMKRAGPSAIKLNSTLSDWSEDTQHVTLRFCEKYTGRFTTTEKAEVVIACDGINSIVRQSLYPDERDANWSGIMMWRGVVKGPKFLTGKTMVMVGKKDCKFVAYPISEFADGNILINWICDLRYPPEYDWQKQDWNRTGKLSDIFPFFKDWRFSWLDVPSLLNGTSSIFEYPMVDRNPLSKWTFGKVTLLGDAAHAMYPIGSNGASQAILDSVHLAAMINKYGINEKALLNYEKVRLKTVNKIVEANRLDGPDKILDIVAHKAPKGFLRIQDILSEDELDTISNQYKKTAGFDVNVLNASKAILH